MAEIILFLFIVCFVCQHATCTFSVICIATFMFHLALGIIMMHCTNFDFEDFNLFVLAKIFNKIG